MEILIPGTSHVITWSKQLLSDTATYYVQVVIRDVRSNTILETINLTALDSSRFQGFWNVVQDPTGQGREIEFQKTVYDDPGYTQPSAMYGRWLDRALILQLATQSGASGGGGGPSATHVDYEHIELIFKKRVLPELISQLVALLKDKFAKDVNLDIITGKIDDIGENVRLVLTDVASLEYSSESFNESNKRAVEGAEHVATVIKSLSGEVKEIKNDTTETIKTLNEESSARGDAFIELVKQDIKKGIDSMLEESKRILSESAEEIGNKLSADIESQISRPMKVRVDMDTTMERDKKPKEEKPKDTRVDRLMSFNKS